MASSREAIARLMGNVIETFDWAYVECSLDSGEPDLQDDVRTVCDKLEEMLIIHGTGVGYPLGIIHANQKRRPMRPLSRIRGERR